MPRTPDVPNQVTLAGIPIAITPVDGLVKDRGYIGCADYETQQILIDVNGAAKETVEQTYMHELVHWAFYVMGRQDLCQDESFVETLSQLLYQAKVTAK